MFYFGLILILLFCVNIHHRRWKAEPWPQHGIIPPNYQGHRGFWKEGVQENTLASFRAAKDRQLKMCEIDVRLSSDGIPVVFHDPDFVRIHNNTEQLKEKIVSDLTARELFEVVGAPTLEEVLKSSDIPDYLNIEIKSASIMGGQLDLEVAKVIVRTKSERRVMISSFNPFVILRMSKLLPEVPRALLASEAKEAGNRYILRKLWLAPYIKTHALHLDYRFVTVEKVKEYSRRNIPVALWTVNELDKAEAYLEAGAISIISDTLV